MDLRLDPLRVSDAAEMTGVLSDPALYTVIGGAPPSEAELHARYVLQTGGRSADGSEEWLNWVVRVEGTAVGYVQATVYADRRAEIAWVIGVPWQGRGHGTDAARELLRLLGERGVERVEAYIAPGHLSSEAVAARLGLTPTGDLDDDGEQRWQVELVPPT